MTPGFWKRKWKVHGYENDVGGGGKNDKNGNGDLEIMKTRMGVKKMTKTRFGWKKWRKREWGLGNYENKVWVKKKWWKREWRQKIMEMRWWGGKNDENEGGVLSIMKTMVEVKKIMKMRVGIENYENKDGDVKITNTSVKEAGNCKNEGGEAKEFWLLHCWQWRMLHGF